MANRHILQQPSKLFATTNKRWSEPPHRQLAWHSYSTSGWPPADTSRSGFVTAQAQEETSSGSRRSENSSQDSRSSVEKSGVRRSGTAYSDCSLELASSDNRGALHSTSWRPSFFRIGPMIGLTVRLCLDAHLWQLDKRSCLQSSGRGSH